MDSHGRATIHFPKDTLRYILSLIDGDPLRNVYIRETGSTEKNAYAGYDWCIEEGWLEEVERRIIDTWPGEERAYRLTREGYEYAKRAGLLPAQAPGGEG